MSFRCRTDRILADATPGTAWTVVALLGEPWPAGIGLPRSRESLPCPELEPWLGALLCAYLATTLSGRDPANYLLAGVLLAVGVLLWLINRLFMGTGEPDPAKLSCE